MVPASSWDYPGDGLVGRIFQFLPCLAHRALFGAVCKNWLVVAFQNRRRAQLPWILLPSSTAAAQEACFFCLLCRTRHRAVLPDDVRGARWIGSFHYGWLILALQQTGGYVLHNLHNGRRVSLPEVLRTPGAVNDSRMVVHAACVAVRDEGGRVVYVARWSASTIVFWSFRVNGLALAQEPHGGECWADTLPYGRSIADVRYYGAHGLEGFHVLTDEEEVLVYVLERAPDGAVTTRLVTYRFPGHEVTRCAVTRYIVKYVEEILMVARIGTPDEWTRAFHVFKLVPELPPEQHGDHGDRPASWVPMHVIPSGIIVLGRSCSRSYPTHGIDFDGVYFLDDATSPQDEVTRAQKPAATRLYPCRDMGWVPLLEHDNIRQIFPARLPSESSRAVWFFP